MQNKLRHRQCRIAGDAQSDKFGLALVRKMRVGSLLLRHGALPARLATSGLIIVAREEPRLIRETQNLLDGLPQSGGAPTRKIRARRARVRHKDGVVDEGGVADDIGDGGQRVTWRENHVGIELTDTKPLAILEQTIPLRYVGGKGWPI